MKAEREQHHQLLCWSLSVKPPILEHYESSTVNYSADPYLSSRQFESITKAEPTLFFYRIIPVGSRGETAAASHVLN
jgi:hypothetical protein